MSGWDFATWDWYDWLRALAFVAGLAWAVRWLWRALSVKGGESGFPTGLP